MVPGTQMYERMRSYYGADEKLRVVDRRTCVLGIREGTSARDCFEPEYTDRPTWEEYRYDALDRRVLTYTDQMGWACTNPCIRGVTRTAWDGDQILAEVRAPYTVAEQDLGPVPAATIYRRGYGQVLYTHGPSLDYPSA